jgi:hypothetical protein
MFIYYRFYRCKFFKDTVFWAVTMGNLVDVYQRFGGTCCLHLHGGKSSFDRGRAGVLSEPIEVTRTIKESQISEMF